MHGRARLNPYIIIGTLIALAAAFFGGDHIGHGRGVNEQKVANQREFDRIEGERTKQKAEANALYRQAQADIIALQTERDKLKTELEKKREIDRKATDDDRAKFSGLGLRFQPAEDAGHRGDGICSKGSGTNAAGPADPATIELPASLTAELRQIAFDADKLADDYRECYGYAQAVK